MARFALFTNGVKVETLDELRENYNISDMLQNFESKALHRWLACNGMKEILSKVEEIASADNTTQKLADIFYISADIISAQQKELDKILEQEKEVLSEFEKELLTDIEKDNFLKNMSDSIQYTNALSVLRNFAESGNPVAQLKLGWCFEYGLGVEENLELAVELYEKSAEKGLSQAQNSLGDCLKFGVGVEQNIEEALYWYKKASMQNCIRAKCSLIQSHKMSLSESVNLIDEVIDIVKKEQNLFDGDRQDIEMWLGDLYWNDIYSQKDYVIQDHLEKALHWYLLALGNHKQIQNVEAAFKYLDVCMYLMFFADCDICRLFRIREVIKVVIELDQREITGIEAYLGILKTCLTNEDIENSGVTLPDYCIMFCRMKLEDIIPTIIKDAEAGVLCAMSAICFIHANVPDEVDCYLDRDTSLNFLKKAAKQKYQFAQKFLSEIIKE